MNMVANLNQQGSSSPTPAPHLAHEIKNHPGLSPSTNSTASPRRRHNTWIHNPENAPASPSAEEHTPDSAASPASEPVTSPTNSSSSTPTSPSSTDSGASGNGSANGSANGEGSGSSRKFFTLKRSQGNAQTQSQAELNTEYENYLAIAKKETFNDVAPLNFLYPAGKDPQGRTVIAMIGSHLPAKKIDLERVMLYAISVMDPVVDSEYVLVYTHTNMSAENRPNFAWLRKMYTIFNRKYKKNLKQLYIVHPTVWIKMTLRLFKPFLSNKFWKKLIYVDHSTDLWKYFQKEDIKLPDSVLNYGAPPRKKQPIFGTSLDEVVARPENNIHNEGGEPREIPKIVDDAVKYLREKALRVEGVFRLSGSNAQIKELKKSFDSGEDVDLSEVEDPHVVAGLLKLYLRELPSPVLVNCHDSLLNCHMLPNLQQQIDCLKMIIASLPKVHKATAKHLLAFFFDVTQYAAENKMTPVNLSIVTAPNLVKNPHETMESAIQDTPAINSAVSVLIQNADKVL